MHRIDTSTKEVDKFGAGKHGFTEGDPSTPEAATQSSDDWLDAVQEEIVAPIEHTGTTLEKGQRDQLLLSIRQISALPADCDYVARTFGKNVWLEGMAQDDDGLLVCVGRSDGVDAYIVTSTDGGVTWTERAPAVPKARDLNAVVWSSDLSLFCAVGSADGVDAYILTSPDGINWTERAPTVSKNIFLSDVIWAGGSIDLFIAVGQADGANGYILTSPDGVTWTERDGGAKNITLYGVAWNGISNFVAVGAADGANAYVLISSNGTTWAEVDGGTKNFGLTAVAYIDHLGVGGGRFVAVGFADGADAYILTSDNLGAAWTERANPQNLDLYGIGYDGVGHLIAGGNSGGLYQSYIVRSFDGVTWRSIYSPLVEAFRDAFFDPVLGSWLLPGSPDGANANILQSLWRSVTG